MPIPIVIALYAAAGALAGAGAGGTHVLVRRARQEAALDASTQDQQNIRALLRQQIQTAELAAQAAELGVDVEAVIRGYERAQSDAPSLNGLLKELASHGIEVPSTQPSVTAGKLRDTETDTVTAAEYRQWAQQEGLDVADRGRIPERIKDAYWAAHPRGSA